MPKRPPKGNPDLNVVTFCDIVTVSIVALFMALVIVIDISIKTPKLKAAPISFATTNVPVYVDCRDNQLYIIDRTEIEMSIDDALRQIRSRAASGDPVSREEALGMDIGNDLYRIDNGKLAVGQVFINPRPGKSGMAPPQKKMPGPFASVLSRFNTNTHYMVYVVRNDSFDAFRSARDLATQYGFRNGWEYVAHDESISFEGVLRNVKAEL